MQLVYRRDFPAHKLACAVTETMQALRELREHGLTTATITDPGRKVQKSKTSALSFFQLRRLAASLS
jgi:hypothetical protein